MTPLDFLQKMGFPSPDWMKMCGDRESDRNLVLDILLLKEKKEEFFLGGKVEGS